MTDEPAATTSSSPATDEAILQALQAGGRIDTQGTLLIRRPHAYSTSFALEDLVITDRWGQIRQLVFKDLSPTSLVGSARIHRPHFLYDRTREILVYRHLLESQSLGTAEVLASTIDVPSQRYWLFLEHIDGGQLRHVGELEAWEEAARWLARLHSRFEANVPERAAAPLLKYDASFFRLFLERMKSNIDARGDLRAAADKLSHAVARALDVLQDCPATLVHGEFYPANVLIRSGTNDGQPWSVCPIDWEVAGIGPGVLDLAALVAGNWSPQSRERMVEAYQRERSSLGMARISSAQLARLIGASQVLTAIQWLGWSEGWTPPPDQARDWLQDALQASEDLT